MDHYTEFEPETWVETIHDFCCKHVFITFLLGLLLGLILKPAFVGLIFIVAILMMVL